MIKLAKVFSTVCHDGNAEEANEGIALHSSAQLLEGLKAKGNKQRAPMRSWGNRRGHSWPRGLQEGAHFGGQFGVSCNFGHVSYCYNPAVVLLVIYTTDVKTSVHRSLYVGTDSSFLVVDKCWKQLEVL